MLIVGAHLTDAPNDKQQLQPGLESVSPAVGSVARVLVDSGYYSQEAVAAAESRDGNPKVYAAQKRQPHGRSVTDLEQREDPPAPPPDATSAEIMAHRLATASGRNLYALRKQTVEPVFGIIKEAMGFGDCYCVAEKAALEWSLVTTAYNLKRLLGLGMKVARA